VFPARHFHDNDIFRPHISTPDDDRHDTGLADKMTSCTAPEHRPHQAGPKDIKLAQGLRRPVISITASGRGEVGRQSGEREDRFRAS
jgi:hypothetical protein